MAAVTVGLYVRRGFSIELQRKDTATVIQTHALPLALSVNRLINPSMMILGIPFDFSISSSDFPNDFFILENCRRHAI